MASASEAGTPSLDAIAPTSDELTIWGVGCAPPALDDESGADVDTISVVPGEALSLEPEAPVPCRVVPEMSRPDGLRPLAAASASTLTPMRAASALSVSPRWTT